MIQFEFLQDLKSPNQLLLARKERRRRKINPSHTRRLGNKQTKVVTTGKLILIASLLQRGSETQGNIKAGENVSKVNLVAYGTVNPQAGRAIPERAPLKVFRRGSHSCGCR